MKKIISVLITCALATGCATALASDTAQLNTINVIVNGDKITENNILYNDRTYIPLRAVFEKIGCEVSYDDVNDTANIVGSIIKSDDAGILSTYEDEYSATETYYNAVIAASNEKDDLEEAERLKREFEVKIDELKEKYEKGTSVGIDKNNSEELEKGSITISVDGGQVEAQLNMIKVMVNDTLITAPNILFLDRTYIPLRAVAEEVGCFVDWDEPTVTASIVGDVEIKHETVRTSYEQEYAELKAKYDPLIEGLRVAYQKKYDDAFDYSIAATGGQAAGDPEYAAQESISELKEYEDKKAEYERRIEAIKVKYDVTE